MKKNLTSEEKARLMPIIEYATWGMVKGTADDYTKRFMAWAKYAKLNDINPLSPSLEQVATYLDTTYTKQKSRANAIITLARVLLEHSQKTQNADILALVEGIKALKT